MNALRSTMREEWRNKRLFRVRFGRAVTDPRKIASESMPTQSKRAAYAERTAGTFFVAVL
jgi:hypothetical protein